MVRRRVYKGTDRRQNSDSHIISKTVVFGKRCSVIGAKSGPFRIDTRPDQFGIGGTLSIRNGRIFYAIFFGIF